MYLRNQLRHRESNSEALTTESETVRTAELSASTLPKVVVLTVGLVNSNFEDERSCLTGL